MAEFSAIGWTDATFNPWRGCTPIGAGCDFCYALARDLLYESGKGATEPAHFGSGKPRIRAKEHTLNMPFRLVKEIKSGKRHPSKNKVFTLSLGDFADNEVDEAWRIDMWDRIRATPELRYLLVTKRIGNVLKMIPQDWESNFRHCGVIATVIDQPELDRDAGKLREVKKFTAWVGLSVEPQLASIDARNVLDFVDWIIGGGESQQMLAHGEQAKARPYDMVWARQLIQQCDERGVAYFQKQCGANVYKLGHRIVLEDKRAGADPENWPAALRVQQFPEALR